jgi:hypothetical protein
MPCGLTKLFGLNLFAAVAAESYSRLNVSPSGAVPPVGRKSSS